MKKSLRNGIALAAVVALVLGGAYVVQRVFFGPRTVSALFDTATGIYPGDEVRVSGVKVGTISAITP